MIMLAWNLLTSPERTGTQGVLHIDKQVAQFRVVFVEQLHVCVQLQNMHVCVFVFVHRLRWCV